MIVNILHRPKLGELYPFYRMQQDMAHELKLKVTLFATYPALLDRAMIDEMKREHEEYGDELGLLFGEFHCTEFTKKVPNQEFAYWLYSVEDKKLIAEMLFEAFRKAFGRDPESVASYVLDSSAVSVIKGMCPAVRGGVAACFEEGVPVYHGCNHSWYLFNEGGPWGAWYPSKNHTLRPALNEKDWSGIVAVNHLGRDLVHSFEGRNDLFNTHPPNVMRGKGNDGDRCPYSLNLIDQYLYQGELNDGYSYMNIFVGANWLTHTMNFEEEPATAQKLYRESLEYCALLRDRGKMDDMTLAEFADWFRKNRPLGQPEINLATEILYGSGKQYVWYYDADERVLLDTTQGGGIGDLRPYISHLDGSVGPDSPRLADAAYPFLIQSQRRTGLANHSFDGTRTTLQAAYGEEVIDLGTCRTKCAAIQTDDEGIHVKLTPAKLTFERLNAAVETVYHFTGGGRIIIERQVTELSDPNAELVLTEYFKGCYGTTEYPENMHGITLRVEGASDETLTFAYKCRALETADARRVSAVIPPVRTEVSLEALDGNAATGRAEEGFLFNPFYVLSMTKTVGPERSMRTCLSVAKAQ